MTLTRQKDTEKNRLKRLNREEREREREREEVVKDTDRERVQNMD
jgi:hypothetical protein